MGLAGSGREPGSYSVYKIAGPSDGTGSFAVLVGRAVSMEDAVKRAHAACEEASDRLQAVEVIDWDRTDDYVVYRVERDRSSQAAL